MLSGVPVGNAVLGVGAGAVVVVVGGAVVVVVGGAVVVVVGGAVVVGPWLDVVVAVPEVGEDVGATGVDVDVGAGVVVVTVVAVVVVTVRSLAGLIAVAEFGGRQWSASFASCVLLKPSVCVDVT